MCITFVSRSLFPKVLCLAVAIAACGPEMDAPATLTALPQPIETAVPASPPIYVYAGTGDIAVRAEGYWGLYAVGAVGQGVVAQGGPGVEGGYFRAGTPASPEKRRAAVVLENGDLSFGPGVATPAPSTPVANAVTPVSVAKAWAKLRMYRSGAPEVLSGLNTSSVTKGAAAGSFWLAFATPFVSGDHYACQFQASEGHGVFPGGSGATGEGLKFWVEWRGEQPQMDVTVVCHGLQ